MKRPIMYVFLLLLAVLVLSRPAASVASMIASGNVLQGESAVLSGQYAQTGGTTGSFSLPSVGGGSATSISLS